MTIAINFIKRSVIREKLPQWRKLPNDTTYNTFLVYFQVPGAKKWFDVWDPHIGPGLGLSGK